MGKRAGSSVRHRLARLVATFTIVVAGCAAPSPSAGDDGSRPPTGAAVPASATSTPAGRSPSHPAGAATSSPSHEMALPSRDEPTVPATANVFDRMRTAIAGAAPLARQVDLRSDAADGAWVLEGAVDDGQGPGRLLIAVATRPASSLADPCLDRDYVQGGRCVTRPVPGGLLAVRGLVRADNGVETVVVTYVRADRTSVLAEASNMTLDPAIGPLLPGDPSRLGVTITRDHPVLEVDELVDVVRAVDRALAGCRSVACD